MARFPRAVYFTKNITAALTNSKESLNVPNDMVIEEIVMIFLSAAKAVQNQKISVNFKIGSTETMFTEPLPAHGFVGVNNERRYDGMKGLELKKGDRPEIYLTTTEVAGDFYFAILGYGEK